MRGRGGEREIERCHRVPASLPALSMTSLCVFLESCLLPLLLILASLISGCEQEVVAPPIPATPPVAVYHPSVTAPGQPAEVVEKSLAYLGGPRTIYHEVGPMETVWRISRLYDVTPESIYAATGSDPTTLCT